MVFPSINQDAAQSETDAADLFEESVERERHAALAVSKGPLEFMGWNPLGTTFQKGNIKACDFDI